jgi:heat shock protein HslJ
MKKIIITVILLMISVNGLMGCSAPDSMIEDTRWYLTSYGLQDNVKDIIEESEITATFNSAEGKVSGSGGCNTYFAKYEVRDSKLSIFEMAFTEMACISIEGVMEQEQEFLSLLASAQSFQTDDTKLTIFCSGGQQLHFTSTARLP